MEDVWSNVIVEEDPLSVSCVEPWISVLVDPADELCDVTCDESPVESVGETGLDVVGSE